MIVYGGSRILKAEIALLLRCIYNKGYLYQLWHVVKVLRLLLDYEIISQEECLFI